MLCCVRGSGGADGSEELIYERQALRELPPAVALSGRTLERLRAPGNCLTQLPRHLFICRELRLLDLSDNDISELPAAVSSLSQLKHLDLARNSLAQLPDSLKSLRHLQFLDLTSNPLERLPEPVATLVNLRELFLSDVGLEFLPANFGRLAELRILELRDNHLVALPKSLARCCELRRLDLGQNEFDDLPEVIGKFTHLRELWVDSNSVAEITPEIGNLVELQHLEASDNAIGELPAEFGECRQLVDICLSSNSLEGLPETFGNLVNLVSLKLDSNKLYSLPESIGNLSSLEELMLNSNYLDRLPRTVGRLKKLQCLNVDENLLTSIPSDIGDCRSLTVLSLRSNRLTRLPDELGHLSALKVLNLVRNSLQYLPISILSCGELVALWLSENQSKPFVFMQSDIEPRTGRQVLTCFLLPQISDVENYAVKSTVEPPVSSRHISFVDMKAIKNVEKPGMLRRAPTPYPKELRALAKHAKNVQKEPGEASAMQNAVHIKAANVAPAVRQRFASNQTVSDMKNVHSDWYDANGERSQLKSDAVYDNSYRRDRAIYSESADSAYGGFNEPNDSKHGSDTYDRCETVEERVDDILRQSSHDLYVTSRKADKRLSPIDPAGDRNSISSSLSQNHIYQKSREPSLNECSVPQSQSAYALRENPYGHVKTYSDEMTYSQAKEKIYNRNYSNYNYLQAGTYGERKSYSPVRSNYSYVDDINAHGTSRNYEDGIYETAGGSRLNCDSQLSELRVSPEVPARISPSKLNPPPYHIAATFSKQAQFFNANN